MTSDRAEKCPTHISYNATNMISELKHSLIFRFCTFIPLSYHIYYYNELSLWYDFLSFENMD